MNKVDRRQFLFMGASVGALTVAEAMVGGGQALAAVTLPDSGIFTLPELPYAQSALEPYISANTVSFHYGKHHAGYVKNLNGLIVGTAYENMSLERIIKATNGKRLIPGLIFNNAAQTWNHTFYWNSLRPGAGDAEPPSGKLANLINSQYGHFSDPGTDAKGNWTNPGFKQKLFDAAKGVFGSGWAWVVVDGGRLEIVTTGNAGNPLVMGKKPLLVIDVWEHAYYLDYQNLRTAYLNTILDKLIDWQFAGENLPSRLA